MIGGKDSILNNMPFAFYTVKYFRSMLNHFLEQKHSKNTKKQNNIFLNSLLW